MYFTNVENLIKQIFTLNILKKYREIKFLDLQSLENSENFYMRK